MIAIAKPHIIRPCFWDILRYENGVWGLFPWHLPIDEALTLAHKLIGYAAMTLPAMVNPGGTGLVCELLLVAGGGGAGGRLNSAGTGTGGGGGGGGGIVWYAAVRIPRGVACPIVVGTAGGGSGNATAATSGGGSGFYGPGNTAPSFLKNGYLAIGGGRGGNYDVTLGYSYPTQGGSGGGGMLGGGDGATPLPGYPAGDQLVQGYKGGDGSGASLYCGGGGGGAGNVGGNGTQSAAGSGGAGASYSTSGSANSYSRGGNGGLITGGQGNPAINYGDGGNASGSGYAGGNALQGIVWIQYAGTTLKTSGGGSQAVGGKTQVYFTSNGTFTVTISP